MPTKTALGTDRGLLKVIVGFLLGALLLVGGCTSWKVIKAFDGEYTSEENNRLIGDYCQTCHIHKAFASGDHLDKIPRKYNRKVFRYATECRTCHILDRNWFTEEITRTTRKPKDANKGMYRDFEIEALKNQKERLTEEDQEERRKASEELKKIEDKDDKFLGLF